MTATKRWSLGWLVVWLCAIAAVPAWGGGPRFVTGFPYYTTEGRGVTFFTTTPLYYTDAGDLSPQVSHAQADAMVAAAAATWNVPTATLVLAQGGTLAEHLSSANVYFNGTALVVPDDVKPVNYLSKPIAVVYDTDGSVIDTLLGSGASDPFGCRQNGVVENLDGLDPDGTIHHAMLIVNGRCATSTGDPLMQLQYQLMRGFGRVLGLSWSQLNDDVFTGAHAFTPLAVQYWPVMHPIDVLCNTYTYKCMGHPFTLRPDDVSSLSLLYGVQAGNVPPGKVPSLQGADSSFGTIAFPTGQGMDTANIEVQRFIPDGTGMESATIVSSMTGYARQQFLNNPVLGAPVGPVQSVGYSPDIIKGLYGFARIPISGSWGWDSLTYIVKAINPLYWGDYAVGPYLGQPVTPSAVGATFNDGLDAAGQNLWSQFTSANAAAVCNPGNDGSESAPVAADASGWWSGQLCADSHASWVAQTVKAGHTWTVEVTALDESGVPTENKVHPVLGVWSAADATGVLPTVALTPAALNGATVGMTRLRLSGAAADTTYRIAVADERGHGRPDFNYKARVLYADAVSPVQVGPSGGVITITGQGFRGGNRVLVNGVAATVTGWTANSITALAPSRGAARMTTSTLADVTVIDSNTLGSTTIPAVLSYGGSAGNTIALVSAPVTGETGFVSSTAFAVRVFASDGVTPVPGASVQMTASGSGAVFKACGLAACTLTADATGLVQSLFTPSAAGTLTLTAMEMTAGATVQAVVAVADPVRVLSTTASARWLAAGAAASWTVSMTATQDGLPVAGLAVNWTGSGGLTAGSVWSVTDVNGVATMTVSTSGVGAGVQASVQACAWGTVCTSVTASGVAQPQWVVGISSGAGQSVTASATLGPVAFQLTDTAGHVLQGATVVVYQTVDAWEGACPSTGRCPAAPVLKSSQVTLTSDANGMVTITPLQMQGIASVVNIAAVSGTQGFVSLSLTKAP